MKMGLALQVLLSLPAIGCGEKGASRASVDKLVGTYETQFRYGSERLILKSDMSFVQVFTTAHGQITTKGAWKRSDEFLGPTEILPIGNYSSENTLTSSPIYGQRYLIVHKERGRLKLALNEAADWYYDRVQ
jgi:hypothetical protein